MIETEGGKAVLLTTEEILELARKMPAEEFQALLVDVMRRQWDQVITAELAARKAVTELKRVDAKVSEMAEEICRLKDWTGCREKTDPRGPALPYALWQMAGLTRDLVLKVWTHLGLPEDDIRPKPKGVN